MKKPLILALCIISCFCFSTQTMNSFYETAQNCHDIACIRKEIDQINQELLTLLAKRTAYVKRAGDLKAFTIKKAQDHQRVEKQEKIIIEQALELELPLEVVIPTFRTLVDCSIEFQQNYINGLNAAID